MTNLSTSHKSKDWCRIYHIVMQQRLRPDGNHVKLNILYTFAVMKQYVK